MTTLSPCRTCPRHSICHLTRLGVEVRGAHYVVALGGNPNTGKSTVFNALTGLRQHIGNWPGKTVARAEGEFAFQGTRYKLIDLPGTYSLLATSSDEEIARDFLLFGRPDVSVMVVDATRLERNLNLVFQVLEISDRVVVCLNMMDEARRGGLRVDDAALARELSVPVVATSARSGEGIEQLIEMVHAVADGSVESKPRRIAWQSPMLQRAVGELAAKVADAHPGLPNSRWVALRLLGTGPK